MPKLTFSKKQILLSVPGALFALIGLSVIATDPYTTILMALWGVMFMPVFWIWTEVMFRKQISFLQRVGIFFLVLLCVSLIAPETPPDTSPVQDQIENAIEETAVIDTVSPDENPDTAAVATPQEQEGESVASNETKSGTQGRVVSVTDGDTLKVSLNGTVETIRVIGIDTPETVHPTKPVECFGIEASNKAKELLAGKTVTVVTDPSQGTRDKYDRYLAYIILEDGSDFGEVMLRGGYAYEYTYDIPYQNQSAYKKAEDTARTGETGLWADGACGLRNVGEIETQPAATTPVAPAPSTTEANCNIKGNISYSTGEKIYHVPGQENYNDTVIDTSKGESWFCTESEAVQAGWRKAKR